MALLLADDYDALKAMGITFTEDESHRFFVFRNYPLPLGLYNVASCDVIVVIPPNYNQAGNDMFWTYPYLTRLDGRVIPAILQPGGGDNRIFEGREFCRWSRHWNNGNSVWRAGIDSILTIQRRIECALQNPDASS